jgi:hypothetical protein
MGQIHAMQLVAGGVQMRFHAAKGQTEDLGDLLISLAARRPKQTLLFPVRQMDRKGGQFEIDMRGGINENRQEFKLRHIGGFVDFPFLFRKVAGERNQREYATPVAQRNREPISANAVVQGVGEEAFVAGSSRATFAQSKG